MIDPVLLIHAFVILVVPCGLGYLVLSRVIRESDIAILTGGSVALGLAMMMVLMNELRFLLPMDRALWFAYKGLILAGLLLLVWTRQNKRLPRACAVQMRPRLLVCTLLGGAVFVSCFFGWPAFNGILHDAWWFHYPVATQIHTIERFPLHIPFGPDSKLYYHYGPDLLAATIAHAFDVPVAKGFAILIALCAGSGFILAYGLLRRATHSPVAGLAGAALLYLGGNLRWLLLPAADWDRPLSMLATLNSQTIDSLLKLCFTPSHAVGIPLSLLIITLWHRTVHRCDWKRLVVLGLLVGALSLVAEWYFFPLIAAFGLHALFELARGVARRDHWQRFALRMVPLIIAVAACMFNNSYVAGLFERFWMRSDNVHMLFLARQLEASPTPRAVAVQPPSEWPSSYQPQSIAPPDQPIFPNEELERWAAHLTDTAPVPSFSIPLRLNLSHLGRVPTWEDAASTGGGFTWIWNPRFLSEALPVLIIGLGAGWWLVRRSRGVLPVVALLVFISCLPPVLLDWGYRSSDFLRFFTGAVSFAALLCGWLVGRLWGSPRRWHRPAAIVMIVLGLGNAVAMGVIGLMPQTMDSVRKIGDTAGSLKTAAEEAASPPAPETPVAVADVAPPPPSREVALERLAARLKTLLGAVSPGREAVLVTVPESDLPPVEHFPDFLKLVTLAEVDIPIGWHWSQSGYTQHYRRAALSLDPRSIRALDMRWVIETNLFGATPSPEFVATLRDTSRFVPSARLVEGTYYINVYRVHRP